MNLVCCADVDDFSRHFDVSRETLDHLQLYHDVLVKWQKAKNLISNSTLNDIWLRHIYDSAQLYPLIRKKSPFSFPLMLDIGSGAGFPAMVLSIMGLGTVHLVEANSKKGSFLRQIALQTKANAIVHSQRIEKISPFKADIITARACASLLQLLEWAENFMHDGSEFWLLKGETADKELTEAQTSWKMETEIYDSQSHKGGKILHLRQVRRL